MDSTTIVLLLVWFYLCCQALGSLVALISHARSIQSLFSIITLSTVLLGVCLWQCNKAGYLVTPMTWYHWVLVLLLLLLQVMAVVMALQEQLDHENGARPSYGGKWKVPIYGITGVLLVLLGCTLLCGWKCNLFCRPCCKSQYICYGSAVVVALVVMLLLAVTLSMIQYHITGHSVYGGDNKGETEKAAIQYLGYLAVPCTQCYATAVLWITIFKLPYVLLEVVALLAAALAMASLLTLAIMGNTTQLYEGLSSTIGYPLLAVHLIAVGITWYLLEYKAIFCYPKEYLCLGIFAFVLLVTLVVAVIANVSSNGYGDGFGGSNTMKYTLLGYSFLLMVPTLWYAHRCNLFTWCIPKKKGLKGTNTAENTTPDSDIAKES